MKRTLSVFSQLLITLSATLLLFTSAYSEPSNLGLLRNDLKSYYDSSLYHQELTQSIQMAQQYIITEVLANQKRKVKHKLALVLDIDETSLSNYAKMVKRDFVANHEQINQEILAADSPAIEPMLTLYREVLKHDVAVFFITGRKESLRKATETNLIQEGYTTWSGLYLRPDNYPHQSIIPFKSQARAELIKKGYTIVATIGDQHSDIQGGYTKKGFKLPNPFYYLP